MLRHGFVGRVADGIGVEFESRRDQPPAAVMVLGD